MEKKIVRRFIIANTLSSLSIGWFFTTYILFILDQGYTMFHANLVGACYMVACFLARPFGGYLADRLGQKRVYLVGQVFLGLGMLTYWLSRSLPAFILAEVVLALGTAGSSGVLESWTRNHCEEKLSHKAVSASMALGSVFSIPTALLGSYLGEQFGLEKPWLFSGLSFMATATVVYFLLRKLPDGGEPIGRGWLRRKELAQALSGLKEVMSNIGQCVKTSWKIEHLRFTILVAFFSAAAFQPINTFWTPLVKEVGGSFDWLRLVWIFIALASSLGSILAMTRWLKVSGRGIALVLLVSGVPIFLALGPQPWLILIGLAVHEIGRGALHPLLFSYSNLAISSTYRATFNSIRGSLLTLGAAFGLVLPGLLSIWFSPQVIWGISATALTFCALYAWRRNSH